jgi:dipeptidyl aminopeptidase/acylaminoacyl peptidase
MKAAFRFTLILTAKALLGVFVGTAAERIPVETFFRKPEFAALSLSPSGNYLAALAPVQGRLNLHIIDVATMTPSRITAIKDDINSYVWKSDDRLLFTMDDDGNESFGLFGINRDGTGLRTLVTPARSQIEGGSFVVRQTFILDLLRDEPDEILVISNDRFQTVFDVYRMNVRTGRKKRIETNPGNVAGWLTDHKGVVRAAAEVRKDGSTAVLYRSDEREPWQKLAEFGLPDEGWSPLAFDYDNNTLFIACNEGRDRSAVYTYEPASRTRGDLILGHDVVDVAGVMLSDLDRKLVGVAYEAEKPEIHWIDPEYKRVHDMVNEALPDTFNVIQRPRGNRDIALVQSFSDREPGAYYLLSLKDLSLRFLLRPREWIDPAKMAEMKPVSYKARDGLTIHGYLTLPVGSDGKNLPLIVNPHGGPQARDSWGYNSEVQFLANRGYAVLQMNFRGSTGYGLEFVKRGWRQWGRQMQDDISDGVKWAIEQGIADPKRVGIYGGSYGGYAALAGLVFTPELYQFGINVVGVSDLELLHTSAPKNWELGRPGMEAMIGKLGRDSDEMRQWSPVNHIEKLRVPLFMAYGEQDPRVVLKHATLLERELKRHKKDYKLIVFADEGHGFSKQENQFEYYNAMDEFLSRFETGRN